MGLLLQSFSSIQEIDTRPAIYLTELGLGPIQTFLEAFLGFLVKTKMKAYTKLTVVIGRFYKTS